MIIPLTLPSASSSSTSAGTLPPALAQLGSSELFLLELQGELEVAGDKHGQVVGRLTIDDSDSGKGKPTLRIGHHLLEGKIVSLPKPLAVLQRVRTPLPSPPSLLPPPSPSFPTTPDGEDRDRDRDRDVVMQSHDNGNVKDDNATAAVAAAAEAEATGTAATSTTSYAIRTLVRKKIVFSKRPTPIVGLSAKTMAAGSDAAAACASDRGV